MYLLLPTGDECVMYAGRHGHVPCTEQRDFHVPSPPLSKQWLLLRNTTPREREPGEKNTWPGYLMCTRTQADPETPSRRAPEKEQVGYTTCPISTCPVWPPQADADSPPMCRCAERLQDPVAWPESRALQDEQQTNGSWHSVGIVACGIFSTVASGGNKQQDSMRNIGSPTWVRQGLFVCEQTRCYALIPAWGRIFSAQ